MVSQRDGFLAAETQIGVVIGHGHIEIPLDDAGRAINHRQTDNAGGLATSSALANHHADGDIGVALFEGDDLGELGWGGIPAFSQLRGRPRRGRFGSRSVADGVVDIRQHKQGPRQIGESQR